MKHATDYLVFETPHRRDWLERLAPHEPVSGYRHNVGEDNADAHLKRQLLAHQVVLAITQ